MKKVLLIMVALVMVLAMVVGCAKTEAPVADAPAADEPAADAPAADEPAADEPAADGEFNPADYAIGIVTYPTSNPTVAVMAAGFMDTATELGYDALLIGGDTSDAAIVYQMLDATIAQYDNLKAITFNAGNETGWKKVKEITDKGIKVICCWNTISDEVLNTYGIEKDMMLGWYSPNPIEYGYEAGKAMGEAVGGKGTIAVTESAFNETEDNAALGFKNAITELYPDIKLLDPQVEGLEAVAAIGTITSIIQANPDLVGAYGTTGTSIQSWSAAKDNTGWEGKIIGMDFNAQNLDLLEDGHAYAIVAQPIYDAFKACALHIDAHLRGEDGDLLFDNYYPSPVIYAADVPQYKELISGISVYESVKLD